MNETDEYFAVSIVLNFNEHFLIWISSDADKFVVTAKGGLAVFPSMDKLLSFSRKAGIESYSKEVPQFDFDAIVEWIENPDSSKVDCNSFLDAWNFFIDIEVSFGRVLQEPDGSSIVYDKLFFGNNLPPVTPQGEIFVPVWSQDETSLISSVFEAGLRSLTEEVADAI